MSTRVLIVDDDTEFRSFLRAVLEPRGYTCVFAGGQSEAWSMLRQEPFALLVVDGVLPDGSGVDFIATVRAEGLGVPVLFVSAYRWDDATLGRLSGPLGVVEVLNKPISAAELLLRARATLELARRRAGEGGPPAPGQDSPYARMQALREGFGARVPRRLNELEEAIRGMHTEGPVALERAARIAHQLRGAAGVFGHQRLSSSAARLEQLLRQALDQPHKVGSDWWGEVSLAIARARSGLVEGPDVHSFLPDMPSRVLVVAQDPAALEEAARFAKARRLDLLRASDGEQALARAREDALPDGALIEVELGGGTGGFDVAEALREVEGLEGLPVAFFSGDGAMAPRLAAARLGAELYLPKPLSSLDLGYAVRGLVDRRAPEAVRAVLLSDDDQAADRWAEALSEAQVEVTPVADPTRLLDEMASARPEVLLVDLATPRVSVLDLVRAVRANPRWQLLPVLAVNSPEDPEVQAEVHAAGADDCLTRELPEPLLLARLRGRVERYRLTVRVLARDPVTGLYPRPVFREYVQRLLSEARRRAETVCLALLALDRQEERVQAHGAALADHHRAAFGRIIHAQLRRHDLRGYWGEDLFALAFMNERPMMARIAVQRVMDDLAGRAFRGAGGAGLRLSASAGIVSFPTAGTTVDELVEAAEVLLRRAQSSGGGRIEL